MVKVIGANGFIEGQDPMDKDLIVEECIEDRKDYCIFEKRTCVYARKDSSHGIFLCEAPTEADMTCYEKGDK